VLAVERVSKSFSGARSRVVLHDVSLHLAAGEYIAVMGESGAGKSTLLNLIAGLDVPDSGRIVVAGQDLAALDDAGRTRLRRARMGFIFQAFHLLPHLTVGRNVGLPLALNGAASPAIDARVQEMLAAVGMLERRNDLPNQLSGGEMQRVAIARALAHRPSLVLADEPTGNLDPDLSFEIMNLFREINARGTTVLVATHDRELIRRVGRRTLSLEHGSVVEAS
jgi:putative ABC transport system ATP-binding protein